MVDQILSPQEAKSARTDLGLSQTRVSCALNINRSYLSQFESGKFIFDDHTFTVLNDYYENQSGDFINKDEGSHSALEQDAQTKSVPENSINQAKAGLRIIDGFVIPDEMSIEQAENILADYHLNNIDILELCEKKPISEDF